MKRSVPSLLVVELAATALAIALFLLGVASAEAVRREWPVLGAWLASRVVSEP